MKGGEEERGKRRVESEKGEKLRKEIYRERGREREREKKWEGVEQEEAKQKTLLCSQQRNKKTFFLRSHNITVTPTP